MKFLDTNVLLYAVSTDPAETRKAGIAIELLGSPAEAIGISVQVLQEFYVQATRSSRSGALSHRLALEYLEHWQEFRVQDNTVGLFRAAVASAHRFGISFWDAAVIEAARLMGCDTVLSEDLNDGQNYGGVRVRDPFKTRAARPRVR